MDVTRILVLIGLLIGLVSIALGIGALATPQWIKSNSTTYGLLLDNLKINEVLELSELVKILNITGLAVIAFAVIFTVIINIFIKIRVLQIFSVILLIPGPILIFVGLILFINQKPIYASVTIGYSLILMIIASCLGYIVAIYFAFIIAGSIAVSPYSRRFEREPKIERF